MRGLKEKNGICQDLDWNEYAATVREMSAAGCVLLKNDDGALPVGKGERVAVFGRIQLDYYNAGAGSGGMVNVPYVVNIPEGLRLSEVAVLDEELYETYTAWEKEHPFEEGHGWATEPFYQEEMPLTRELVLAAADRNDLAVIIIGRMAGEDKDAQLIPGSYYLTDDEKNMLSLVTESFKRTVVLLNVGAIMDMSWVEQYAPSAVMYIWQGGLEGGNAVADVLCGKVSPSGHLADTIARRIEDYPAYPNYGNEIRNIYAEDIFTGYRYFETGAKDKVLYPFGFGLSYTQFDIKAESSRVDDTLKVKAVVENTGLRSGRCVLQVYVSPPAGLLSVPSRVLAGFAKTDDLPAGEKAELEISIPLSTFASYDDGGYTGNRGSFILEKGEYTVFVGENIRDARPSGSFVLDGDMVTERVGSACMPVIPFDRLVYDAKAGSFSKQAAPLRDYDIADRIEAERERIKKEIPDGYTGDKGIKCLDVFEGRAPVYDFLNQLSDEDLMIMCRMEGVYSPRSVDGTVGAFGGVSDRLSGFGIPVACCTDGPSGIRLDDGSMAFSLPSGTLIACSFDTALTEKLFSYEGRELTLDGVDALLGPGINIHRFPLNGRNFEYFSEDPLLTGKMAAAQLRGMASGGATGTIKHFCANNQEKARTRIDSVVSERALREIYLKPFEIAVKEGLAYSIMSTYGALNGIWTGGSFDLQTTVLRHQWKYDGVVMTDWWAMINDELTDNDEPAMRKAGPMIRAQNDLYSVHKISAENTGEDNMAEWLSQGRICRGELLRSAANILSFIFRSVKGKPESITESNRPEYDGKDKNRRIDEALQSPPAGNV